MLPVPGKSSRKWAQTTIFRCTSQLLKTGRLSPSANPLCQFSEGEGQRQQEHIPLAQTIFSPRFGIVVDRFGVSCMVLVEL